MDPHHEYKMRNFVVTPSFADIEAGKEGCDDEPYPKVQVVDPKILQKGQTKNLPDRLRQSLPTHTLYLPTS